MQFNRTFFCAILALALITAIHAFRPQRAHSLEQPIRNSLGMEFVLIPAGEFIMGSPESEPSRDPGASEIQHKVTLTRPFYMQTTEVTLAQWRQLMGRGFFFRWNGPDTLPVAKVSWHDAQAFIKKLNRLGEGKYRLPSEAEWEYAARAGTRTAYFWGDTADCAKAMFGNSKHKMDTCQEYIRRNRLPLDGPAPVKNYAPNAWGLYDMHGNVWEWVEDRFGPYTNQPQTDPAGAATGESRVRRGGSWFALGNAIRSANRAYGHPASRFATTGLRVVKMVEP
jgi:formylglycine-generating enzyme required for sulfatase activity